jgi:hypothetical protein
MKIPGGQGFEVDIDLVGNEWNWNTPIENVTTERFDST